MRFKTLPLIVATGAVLVAGLTFGVAEASASGPNVTYYACLSRGKLTHVGTTTPTCPSPATQVSWNSQGPVGPQGPAGSPGTNGTNGTVEAFGHATMVPNNVNMRDAIGPPITSTSLVTIASKTVPVGDYAVFAHVSLWISPPGAGPEDVVCQLYNGLTPVDITNTTVNTLGAPSTAGFDVPLMGTFASDGTIKVECSDTFTPGSPVSAGAQIVAIPANSLG